MSKSGFFWNDKKSIISLIIEQRFKNRGSRPIMTEEVSRNWMELSSLNEEKLIILLQVMNNSDEINNFFKNNFGIFAKLKSNVFMRWKNSLQIKSHESMNLRGEDWSKIETLLMNSRPEFRNYGMKLIVWMIREIFKMLNQYAVHNPTLPVNQCFSHLIQILADCWVVLWECRAATMGRQVCRKVFRETFLHIQRRFLQHLIRKSQILGSLMYQNTHHHMWWVKAKRQLRIRDASQDRQPEIQSSLVREDFQRIMGQTNNDCRFRILILTNSRTHQRSLVGRWDSRLRYVLVHNFLRKVCYGSKKWNWLIQWMISTLRAL